VQRYQEATVAQAVQLMASMAAVTADLAPTSSAPHGTPTPPYAELFDGWSPASCSPRRRGLGRRLEGRRPDRFAGPPRRGATPSRLQVDGQQSSTL
jgi:hypothetical protein